MKLLSALQWMNNINTKYVGKKLHNKQTTHTINYNKKAGLHKTNQPTNRPTQLTKQKPRNAFKIYTTIMLEKKEQIKNATNKGLTINFSHKSEMSDPYLTLMIADLDVSHQRFLFIIQIIQ